MNINISFLKFVILKLIYKILRAKKTWVFKGPIGTFKFGGFNSAPDVYFLGIFNHTNALFYQKNVGP